MARVTFPVTGMTCAACQSFVQKTLEQQTGVESAAVNLLLHNATVTFDPAAIAPEKLVAVVEDTGYGAYLPAARRSALEEQEEFERRARDEFKTLAAQAAVALAAGALAMLFMHQLHHGPWRWVLLFVTLAVLLFSGRRFFLKAWSGARHGALDMNTLIALGAGATFLYSAALTIFPSWFSARGLDTGVYFEGVLFILGFVLLGNVLEARAKRQTAAALKGLLDLQPKRARVERNGEELTLPVESLVPGDILLARPGEAIAADGVVLSGAGSVDESLLTGEPMPVDKLPGARVRAGTLNRTGALRYRAEHVGAQTMLDEVVRLLRDAQGGRPAIQKLADRISAIFVPTVLALSLLTFLAWLIFLPGQPVKALASAVSVLVIACPCAMGLAVPTAVMVATGRAARLGLLIQDGEALERLASIRTVIFDKTGTLTLGRPEVLRIDWAPGFDASSLPLLAALEKASEHPLGEALVRHAGAPALPSVEDFESLPGQGVRGRVQGHDIRAGRQSFIPGADSLPVPGGTALWASIDGRPAAVVSFTDPLRPEAPAAIEQLRRLGLTPSLLTGDRPEAAAAVARSLAIGDVVAGVLPAGKVDAVRARSPQAAMVGDGINDAPALAAASVGIAMASGSDISIAAAGLTLLRPDLLILPAALQLARRTLAVIRQNLFWAFLYNVICIPVAAFGLLDPRWAAAAMALSSVSVVSNSLRLRRA